MKIAILGSGPSFILFKDTSIIFDYILFSNALIDKIDLKKNSQSQYIYIAHERRLLNMLFIEKVNDLVKKKIKVILGGELYGLVSSENITGVESIEKNLPENSVGKILFNELSMEPDLLRNVVTDYSIPLALTKNPTELHLFGCDFNYQYFKKNQNPAYALSPIGGFDHTISSANNWAKRSDEKYRFIKNILKEKNIKITRHKISKQIK